MRAQTLAASLVGLTLSAPAQAGPPVFPHGPKIPTHPNKKLPQPELNPDIVPGPSIPVVPLTPPIFIRPELPVKGDLSCRRGDPDCNPCTANVRGQFAKMRRGKSKWKRKPWRFKWGQRYAPDSIRPFEAFDSDTHEANALGLSHAHPQAFVRTNEGPSWYAGTHSQKEEGRPGTVFIVHQNRRGKKRLVALHRTKTQHPNGLHVLGRYLLFGERPTVGMPDELRVIDLRRRTTRQDITHLVPEATGESKAIKQFGGGLGSVKLSDGRYLLISTVPGDRHNHHKTDGTRIHRIHQFYGMQGDITDPANFSLWFVNEQRFTPTSRVPQKYEYSENLSMVTECGTGDIYAMHSSGDGEGLNGLEGTGYWRLSQLVRQGDELRLNPIDVFEVPQSAQTCHMRSAASVGVGPNGKLEFLCHQYRKDPDPSVVEVLRGNVFSGNISGKDHWNFSAGVPE